MTLKFLARWFASFRNRLQPDDPASLDTADDGGAQAELTGERGNFEAPGLETDAPLELPLDGVLDLHTFRPKEVPSLLDEWLRASAERGISQVRIIHGKGTGVLRTRVHAILSRHPLVKSFRLAGEDGGGWGATLAELRCRPDAANGAERQS